MMLKYKLFVFCILLLCIITISSYSLSSQYLGYWENVDCNTRGITRFYLNPGIEKNELDIHAFGSCTPSDCDWDHTPLYVYSTDVNDKMQLHATAAYRTNFNVTVLTLRFMMDGRILLESYTRFTDNSNRQNYHTYDIFKKVSNDYEKFEPQCPDLIIDRIQPFKVGKGDTFISVQVVVKNIGTTTAGSSVARLEEKTNKQSALIKNEGIERVKSLAPGQSTTVTFTIRYKGKFNNKISVEAEADYRNQIKECDENNNSKTLRN